MCALQRFLPSLCFCPEGGSVRIVKLKCRVLSVSNISFPRSSNGRAKRLPMRGSPVACARLAARRPRPGNACPSLPRPRGHAISGRRAGRACCCFAATHGEKRSRRSFVEKKLARERSACGAWQTEGPCRNLGRIPGCSSSRPAFARR